MARWRPIKTAPKNLEAVAVYDPDYGGVRVAQFECHAKPPFWSIDTEDLCPIPAERSRIEIQPTLWTPLPAPPVFACRCGETRPLAFRPSEPKRCKACRRAYNLKRKHELKPPR